MKEEHSAEAEAEAVDEEESVKAGRKLEHWPLEKSSTRGRC